jgi:hypothetical protein
MDREERQKRLNEILEERKQKEIVQKRLANEIEVKDLLKEVFGEIEMEVLDMKRTESIIEEFSNIFPITFWNRIDWENDRVNQLNINEQDIKDIPSILVSKGYDTSTPIYIFWGYDNYPSVKTALSRHLLSAIDEIVWLGTDLYIYCPKQKYVIEFFHDDSVNIGWI